MPRNPFIRMSALWWAGHPVRLFIVTDGKYYSGGHLSGSFISGCESLGMGNRLNCLYDRCKSAWCQICSELNSIIVFIQLGVIAYFTRMVYNLLIGGVNADGTLVNAKYQLWSLEPFWNEMTKGAFNYRCNFTLLLIYRF